MANTDIKDNKSVLGSHRINNDNISQYEFYSYNKDHRGNYIISSFETIKLFLPKSIGVDYLNVLPKDYFHDVFKRIDDKKEYDLSTLDANEIEYYRNEFSNRIQTLNRSMRNVLKKYVSIVSSSDPENINSIVKIPTKGFNMFSNLSTDDCEVVSITYSEFPTVEEYYEHNKLFFKILEDVEYIMDNLSDIALLSRFVKLEYENSYLKFVYDIFKHMHGNYNALFSRGIVNHSAFKFCIDGYPYNTPSKHLYNISDVFEIKTKTTLRKYYLKNIEALVNFLNDLSFDDFDETESELSKTDFEIKVLKNAYGVMIALLSLYSEKSLYDCKNNSSFTSVLPSMREELRYKRK